MHCYLPVVGAACLLVCYDFQRHTTHTTSHTSLFAQQHRPFGHVWEQTGTSFGYVREGMLAISPDSRVYCRRTISQLTCESNVILEVNVYFLSGEYTVQANKI